MVGTDTGDGKRPDGLLLERSRTALFQSSTFKVESTEAAEASLERAQSQDQPEWWISHDATPR